VPPPRVKIEKQPDPGALRTIKEQASAIENAELREALEKFGEAMLLKD
jgi:hypothetical protein